MTSFHEPVLLQEVIQYLSPKAGGTYLDCTLGGAGHSEAILSQIQPGGHLIGLDADEDALRSSGERLAPFGKSATLVHANFSELKKILDNLNLSGVDGILFDLGVSSYQFNAGERGFSFKQDAPLDMRMDQTKSETAADLVNTLSQAELEKILWEFGEERWAKRIAQFILNARKKHPIRTTLELAEIIRSAIPKGAWPEKIDPATRTFQALRIAVNQELDVLKAALEDAILALNPSGRICVISYHSLEDRIVKHQFLRYMGRCQCPPGLPICNCGAKKLLTNLTRKPILPSLDEIVRNSRARSAKLRAAERL